MTDKDELLSQVNERDEVVGACRRGDAHRLGLRHRSVHIMVFNQYGEIFLQKRSQDKEIDPGLWDTSAAGHVDFGESYDDCALRELREELRIDPDQVPPYLFKVEATEQTGWEFVQIYRMQWDAVIDPAPTEISVGAWFSPAEVEGWMGARPEEFTGFFRALWRRYRAGCE